MKLAIFGGTGLVGSTLVDLAVHQSHEVTMLVRDAQKVPRRSPAVRVVLGNTLDPHAVGQTLDGCDAVMSTLGGYRGPESLSRGIALVLDGMRAVGLRRLIILQGMHLVVPGEMPNPGQRLVQAFMYIRARDLTHHAELMWKLLQAATDIEWTLIRIPRVVRDRGAARDLQIGSQRLGPWNSITRTDAAHAMLRVLHEPGTAHATPLASSRRRPTANAA